MTEFNPERLTIARKRKRLSAQALAELVGVTSVTISRIEMGVSEPKPETVAGFERELGFPSEFFYGGDIDALPREAASFRSLTSITAKERDAALAAGSLAYMLSDWISERFNLPEPDLHMPNFESDPEAAAISLRTAWGIGEQPISNMIRLLEAKGVRVFSLAENTKNVDAFSCWRNSLPYVFLNTFKSAEHSRFDAAHELGHLILHRHGTKDDADSRSAEMEANAFSSAFLMPSADVKSRLPYVTSLDQIIKAKRFWGVSAAALVYRLKKLSILSEWQYRDYYIQMSKLGYRTSEPNGMERETSSVWSQVFKKLWNEKITKNHVAENLNLPMEEIANLVFGLDGGVFTETIGTAEIKKLRLVDR